MNIRDELRPIALPYGEREITLRLTARNLGAVLTPRPAPVCPNPAAEVRRALSSPIGMESLAAAARGARRVVIIADDLTRQTPVDVIIPLLLDELQAGGIRAGQVGVLIALGTHRPMSQAEIQARFGTEVTRRVPVVNHPWQDPAQLADLGVTPNGTPIQVSRLAVEADFLVGLGSVVPHHIPGYSGGAKIVQPGICGPATTGATHLLSIRAARSHLGSLENPVRAEMETIGERVGLKAVFNTVLDPAGRLVRAFFGHPHAAFRAGAALARQVYGVPLAGQTDIVVAGSHPCDIEFWQAHKSLYPADLAVRDGGTIVVVTPAPEGVSVTHRSMLNITALDAGEIERLIEQGAVDDGVSAALALAWAKIRRRASISLVSDGIPADEARALGFAPFGSLDEALAAALRRHGPQARVTVLTHAPETLPIVTL
jgi:nickel-dependent lactate racemase